MPRSLFAVVVLALSASAQDLHLQGELLVSDHACTSCHAATPAIEARLRTKIAPRLGKVGSRVTPQYLRRYLLDPHGTKPGTTMPDVLANVADQARRTRAVEALVHFLVSQGGPIDQAAVGVSPATFEKGRQLYHSVGCVGCHAPKEAAWELKYSFWELKNVSAEEREFNSQPVEAYIPPGTLPSPDVPHPDLATKTTVPALVEFLVNPLHVRPSGRMPSLALKPDEAEAIAHYLLKDQQGKEPEQVPGLQYEYYESRVPGAAPDFTGHEPKRTDVISNLAKLPKHRENNFGFRYRGFVDVPEEGEWTFFTRSDDGSRLSIDGKVVVKNDGTHPMVEKSGTLELSEGRHSIEVTFFEAGGGQGLEVRWESNDCDVKKQIIPADRLSHLSLSYRPKDAEVLTPDPQQVRVGKMLFGMVGCTNCHTLSEGSIDLERKLKAPAFVDLEGKDGGCLSSKPDGKSPKIVLTDEEKKAIAAVLDAPENLAQPHTEAEAVNVTMHRHDCYSCHRRAGVGGTHPLRKEYFKLLEVVDVDESGRLPPDLTGVGRKIHEKWLAATLVEGRRVHAHMAARMPDFGKANVEHLVKGFGKADPSPANIPDPVFTAEKAELGRRLVGIKDGLGCIRCHEFCGRDSLGIPAVDLAPMTQRLKWPWFRDLLLDPNAVSMDTRMPQFWDKGKSPANILNNDPSAQIDAIWAYLTLGQSMPVPDGLVTEPGAYEILPGERPSQVGVFMRNVSPRTVVVGYKERVHVAFDKENNRLSKAWRGEFFNAKGTWHARAGQLEGPASKDVLEMAPGNAFAILKAPDDRWPKDQGRDAGFRSLGRTIGKDGVPTFRYAIGDYVIEERSEPMLSAKGAGFRRRFRVTAKADAAPLWFRAAVGDSAELVDGQWTVKGQQSQRLRFDSSVEPRARKNREGQEVLVPLAPAPGRPVEFDVEVWW